MLAAVPSVEGTFLTDLLVVLASAAVGALLMQRLRLAVIPTYLITGVVIGPHVLQLVRGDHVLSEISHLAIIFLLFGIGLELHLSVLRHNLVRMVLIGLTSCIVSSFLGWGILWVCGLDAPAALAIGMALALSSTAVVMRIIVQRRELHHVSGRFSFAILVIQDLLVVLMLALLPLLARWMALEPPVSISEDASTWSMLIAEAVLRVCGIGMLVILGKIILPILMREALQRRSLETMMIVGVAVALVTAKAAQLMGFSLELGAFVAGFTLAGTPFRHQLGAQIGAVRDLFAALFFTTLGMVVDPLMILQWWWVVLLGVPGLIVLKALVIAICCRFLGATLTTAMTVGISLAQAGEFSLILLNRANELKVLDSTLFGVSIGIVVISLILTSSLVAFSRTWSSAIAARLPRAWQGSGPFGDPSHARDSGEQGKAVIIGGYGPVGQRLAERLLEGGYQVTVVELNVSTVRQESKRGRSIVFGDVSNWDVLEQADIRRADAFVLTIPDEHAAVRACSTAREHLPKIYIAARVGSRSSKGRLEAAGVDFIAVDELSTAEVMLEGVVKHLMEEGK